MSWLNRILVIIFVLSVSGICDAKVTKEVLAKKQSVVTIYIESNKKTIAYGSGFIVDANGLIVTNHHVIAPWEKAREGKLFIKKSDGKFLTPLEVAATDEDKDVAIIRVKEKGLPFIKLATSKPKQGDSVVVIGTPLGFETTVTDGIVSGIRGDDGFVQITAPVSSGSSGSPVLNSNGDAIGVATLVIMNAQNLNFAIPVSYVESLLPKAAGLRNSTKNEVTSAAPAPLMAATTFEEDLQIKMPHMPSKSIHWGMSLDELKQTVDYVTCEKEDEGMVCQYIGFLAAFSFYFEGDIMTGVSSMVPLPKTSPGKLDEDIAAIQQTTDVKPQYYENEDGAFYRTQLKFSSCKSKIRKGNETIDFFYTFCSPGSYIDAYVKPSAKEQFKLLDLTLGESTQEDIVAVCKENNWEYLISPVKGETIIHLYGKGIKIDGVASVELTLIDNMLEAVKYGIDANFSDRGSFYKLLTSKYGKYTKDETIYYVWEVNPDTRDNVSIIMSFDEKPEYVTSISYSLRWLGLKGLETRFYGFMKESNKSQDLKSKAF